MICPTGKSKPMPRPGLNRRARGFSLMETIVSVGVTATLMGGMVSVMSIASRASYNNIAASEHTYQARDVVSDITTDLGLAQSFTERTSTTVAFKVPDRDGDGMAESIKYTWSGGSGGTLTRQYNGGTVVIVAQDVQHFNLNYITKVVAAATPEESSGDEDSTIAALGDTILWKGGSHDKKCYGGATTMVVKGNDDRTGLVGFSLSGVNFTVGVAKLRLYVTSGWGHSKLSIYPMQHTANNASWYEGTSNGQEESGAVCYKYRKRQPGDDRKWEKSNGHGEGDFKKIRGSEIGSIDPDWSSPYTANQWVEITLDASAVDAYRSSGSITLNIKNNSWNHMEFASKEHPGGNGPELVLSEVRTSGEVQESAIAALIEHDNASGGSLKDDKIKSSEWSAQYFKPTLPANTKDWKITGARVNLKKDGSANGVISLEIRSADSNLKPGSTILAQATINESSLSSSYQWVTVNFTPVGELSKDDGFCLVVKYSSGSSTVAKIRYEKSGNPMTSNSHWMTTNNSGSSWSNPESNKDMRFTIYGTVSTYGDPQ